MAAASGDLGCGTALTETGSSCSAQAKLSIQVLGQPRCATFLINKAGHAICMQEMHTSNCRNHDVMSSGVQYA